MPVGVGGAAVLGGSAILGSQQQKKIKSGQKNKHKQILNIHGGMMENLEQGFANQEGYLKKALKAGTEGYDATIADADRLEVEGNKAADRYFQGALGGADGASASRGLLGSTVNANMRFGAARGASRARSEAQIAASRLRSTALLGKGAAKAGGLAALGTFEAYKANSRNNVLSRLFDYYAGQSHSAQSPDFANLAQLAMQLGAGGGGGGGTPPTTASPTVTYGNPLFGFPGA